LIEERILSFQGIEVGAVAEQINAELQGEADKKVSDVTHDSRAAR
jgi:hypothetical protein